MVMQAYREPDGNVVLRSNNFTMRFFWRNGGTPLEWWAEPYPGPITDSFAGAGTSVCWETGQDPTQASANGLLPYPIARLNDRDYWKYIYHCREALLDPAGSYRVEGFMPIFWSSQEWIDDALPADDMGWRTSYRPQGFNIWPRADLPIAFFGSANAAEGIFFVGNEMLTDPKMSWNTRLCEFGEFAGRAVVCLRYAAPDAEAGIAFRKTIPITGLVTRMDAVRASGYHVVVSRTKWKFVKVGLWNRTLASGSLSTTERSAVKAYGLRVDVRCNNCDPSYFEVWLGDRCAGIVRDGSPYRGGHAGCYAYAKNGYITFGDREFFDVSLMFWAKYTTKPDAHIEGHYFVGPAVCVDAVRTFWRCGVGLWMNSRVFPERAIGVFNPNGTYKPLSGALNIPFNNHPRAWIGAPNGSFGIHAELIERKLNGKSSDLGHFSLQQHGCGDAYCMLIMPVNADTTWIGSSLEWKMLYRCRR